MCNAFIRAVPGANDAGRSNDKWESYKTRHVPDAFDLSDAVVGDPGQSGDYLERAKR